MIQAYEQNQLSTHVRELMERAKDYIEGSEAENTKIAHQSDWKKFDQFCEMLKVSSMPATPDTVALFLTHMAESGEYKASTIARHKASISAAHQANNQPSPVNTEIVKRVMSGIKNKLGTKVEPKKALLVEDLRKFLDCIPDTIEGVRDRAILLLSFAGAFRRSELVALDIEDIEYDDRHDGIVVHIRKSKTDQSGEGRDVPIARTHTENCPVSAYVKWIKHAHIESGAIFRRIMRHSHEIGERLSTRAIERLVKKYAELAGYNPCDYAAHSTRSGMVSTAFENGVDATSIMMITGHRRHETLKRYLHGVEIFNNKAVKNIGL